ncbi:hypothetical protein [Bdellovibrio bacteriovorus]|uniref:hypothetical protein n=1 Tax=Bdellovibrio bacteriovorus TaxID=959 RepID=UPI001185F59C|nr:hypothetical protein [Bdellovibrio bacteriovorus]
MNDNFSFSGLEQHISSSRQVRDMANMVLRKAEAAAIKRRGVEAQIESSKVLVDQREELVVMRAFISALLKDSFEQTDQQEIKLKERDKVETARHQENLKFTKIAAWTGVVGIIIGVVSIFLQFMI